MKTYRCLGALPCALLFAQMISIFAQGPLPPPGPPGPTMKTLDQVEARRPIDPTQPGFTLPYIISQRGSYYLAGNLNGTSGNVGIRIDVDDVSLDLNGYAMKGGTGGTSAILVNGSLSGISIRNGTIRGWSVAAVDGSSCDSSRASDLRISQVPSGISLGARCEISDCFIADGGLAAGGSGIQVGQRSLVKNSRVNTFDTGILVGAGSTIENCLAVGNAGHGLRCFDGSIIRASISESNGLRGIWAFGDGSSIVNCHVQGNTSEGINTGSFSKVQDCTIRGNGNTGIVADTGTVMIGNNVLGNGGGGIYTQNRCTIRDNSVTGNNGGDGVRVTADCVVKSNYSGDNGKTGGLWDGFYVSAGASARNVFEGNEARGNNEFGINCGSSTGNTVTRNKLNGNLSGPINVVPSNDVGPTGTAASATSPWANISN